MTNFRQNPERYTPDVELFTVEPYASEIAPHLRLDDAGESAAELYELYLRYREAGEFVGMDMVVRFLKLGRIRTEGIIPDAISGQPLRPPPAAIFSKTYRMAKNDPAYEQMKAQHQRRHSGEM